MKKLLLTLLALTILSGCAASKYDVTVMNHAVINGKTVALGMTPDSVINAIGAPDEVFEPESGLFMEVLAGKDGPDGEGAALVYRYGDHRITFRNGVITEIIHSVPKEST